MLTYQGSCFLPWKKLPKHKDNTSAPPLQSAEEQDEKVGLPVGAVLCYNTCTILLWRLNMATKVKKVVLLDRLLSEGFFTSKE